MEKVLEVIRRDVSEDKVRIDTPTQNLESYFLNVVNKARAQEAETSGATSGNRVAEYLRGGSDSAPTQQARVLDRLTRAEAAPTPAENAPVVQVTNVEALSNKKLEQFTKHEEAPAPAAASPTAEKPKQADLGKANEKLSSLLNKPK
jgi:ABC-2 type transport system ATP-binding protein